MKEFLHLIYLLHVVLRLVWELDATHETHFLVSCFSLAFTKKNSIYRFTILFSAMES